MPLTNNPVSNVEKELFNPTAAIPLTNNATKIAERKPYITEITTDENPRGNIKNNKRGGILKISLTPWNADV